MLLVTLVARRERIVAGGDGIRVAPATVFTLDADFAVLDDYSLADAVERRSLLVQLLDLKAG